MNDVGDGDDDDVSRSEAAKYLYDMAGQPSEMARRFELHNAADALAQVQRVVAAEI
ncbi:MAG: hypothetical protein K2P70_15245 [Hyphomonadaceae bacterium]|nr:hypothetical protein [Hyphomonadaceae bacterium]